jgi:hypothetical protein
MSEFTTTPNYALEKPEVNADSDQWGARLNANSDTIDAVMKANETAADAALPRAGGTLTGPLVLAADPATALQAATRQYVDNHPPLGGPFLPLAGGALTGPLALAADPTTALQAATKEYVDNHPPLGGPFLPLAGGALTGPLALAADPTTALQAATKEYTDAGDAAIAARAADNTGRNLLHNGMFRVQQRGGGPWTTTGSYTADRWQVQSGAGGSRSVLLGAMGDAARAAIGDEEANNFIQYSATGGAAAGDFEILVHRMENVRRLAGKTCTISFWAMALSGTPKVGVSINQVFGSGGSPSAPVNTPVGAVTISTTFARYSLTIALPSVAGKTFGATPGTDFTGLTLWLSSGATNNAIAGNIGVQTAAVNFWGMQLEIGSVATPLEKIDVADDIARAQRFFFSGRADMQSAAYAAGITCFAAMHFPVTLRATPTVAIVSSASNINITGVNAGPIGVGTNGVFVTGGATAIGGWNIATTFTASADL